VFIISNYSFLPLKKILNEFIFGHTENVGNTYSNLHIYPACALSMIIDNLFSCECYISIFVLITFKILGM